MENYWKIALVACIFLVSLFSVRKLTIGRYKKEFGPKRRTLWGQRTFYWEGLIGLSTGVTFLILLLLKSGTMLTF
ncbi:hypothetical protein [Euzebyella saccharophila]|uniref:DUF4181 domain-containing protein n=1 Tax=Euzebyella saccharophila TaxID=679664 RepID=A0ABV8JI07_9FLAO|nr:hypothetical protein [Euzebyella saccharophila]